MTYIAICCDSKKVHASAGSEPSYQPYSKQAVTTTLAVASSLRRDVPCVHTTTTPTNALRYTESSC
eukprot:13537-Heterococcus_DN1.PRE.5